ncbi:hypothetical protein SEA_KARDASHIAN_53 [Streptomyces phage Kardashian]|nr:hypothetical protein SEA_KARDASHIAN_53 [Streptomyces phage Kardashian]
MNRLLAQRPYRVFDKHNPFWNGQDRKQNPKYVHYVQTRLNDILRVRGYVSLNEALELLGFERTVRAGQQGWIRDVDPEEGDGHIDFGVWAEGFARGKDWLNGDLDTKTLYFNVDRVTISMPRRIKKLRAEGKI